MDDGHKDGVTRKTAGTHFNRERTVVFRTFTEADLAAQPLPGEAGVGVHHRDAHAGVANVREVGVERSGRTRFDAGEVPAHVAGNLPRREVRRSDGSRRPHACQPEGVVGTRAHALAAARTGCAECFCRERPGRSGLPAGSALAHGDHPEQKGSCRHGASRGNDSLKKRPAAQAFPACHGIRPF